jgi:hypothetical protein
MKEKRHLQKNIKRKRGRLLTCNRMGGRSDCLEILGLDRLLLVDGKEEQRIAAWRWVDR